MGLDVIYGFPTPACIALPALLRKALQAGIRSIAGRFAGMTLATPERSAVNLIMRVDGDKNVFLTFGDKENSFGIC